MKRKILRFGCDLSPRRPFYQARHGESALWRTELRPEIVEEHCLFVKNREDEMPMIFGGTYRHGDRPTKLFTGESALWRVCYGLICCKLLTNRREERKTR